MSWGRISHPSEMLKIDQEIEVKVLTVDREKEKIALGLKQKTASPWDNIEAQVPRRHAGQGQGGQHHVLRRVRQAGRGRRGPGAHQRDELDPAHQPPVARCVNVGDEVEVVVLEINKDKQEISPGHEAGRGQPLDAGEGEVSAGHGRRGQGPQPDQLRRVRRDRGRHRRPAARHATCPGPRRSATPPRCSRRASRSSASCWPWTRRRSASPWASSS